MVNNDCDTRLPNLIIIAGSRLLRPSIRTRMKEPALHNDPGYLRTFCRHFRLCVLVLLSALYSGCRIWNPNKLFRSSTSMLSVASIDSVSKEYRIRPGDRLSMNIYTNSAYKLIDAGLANQAGGLGAGQTTELTYLVLGNGVARFPMIDTAKVSGYTLTEAATRLEDRYADHLVDPWVQLTVVNRRAIVYRASEQASVVNLPNESMTLLEVIASAGGIPKNGKAYRIKLIRNLPQGTVMYEYNLRDAANLREGQTIVEANDVILIDPTFETTFVAQLTPLLALITTSLAVYAVFLNSRR